MTDTPSDPLRSVMDMLVEALDASSPEPDSWSDELRAACLSALTTLERIHNDQLVDGPTGLFNRQYMEARLRAELARASRHGHPLSILVVRVRGTEGRLDSKSVEQIAKLFGTDPTADTFSFRRSDVCARAGWERFMAVLPETPKWGALTKAERLRRAVLNQGFARAAIGVAAFPEDASDITSLLASAESALKLDQEE